MAIRRIVFSLTLLLWFGSALCQQKVRPLFVSRSTDTLSVNIPGTGIHIKPPAKFLLSNRFNGLENGKAIIEFYDLPGGSFDAVASDFTTSKFESQNLVVLSEEKTSVNGYNGKLICSQRDDFEKNYSLVFGSPTFSVIVIATFPAADVKLGEEIRASLMSIAYGSIPSKEALAKAAFRLDDSASLFRYQKYAANTFYYTPNGRSPIDADDSYLTVTQLAWDYSTTPAMIGELMMKEMSKHGLKNTSVKKGANRKFNGNSAYESEIYATRGQEKLTIYQMVVVHADRAVVIHGIDSGKIRRATENFRKLARTLEFKE